MRWLDRKIDEWRHGPQFRALAEECNGLRRQIELSEREHREQLTELLTRLAGAQEDKRLVMEFLRSGNVKIRCRGISCSNVTWKWETRLVEQQGQSFLVAFCEDCIRRFAREDERRVAATAAAAAEV